MIHAMTCDVEDYFQVSAFDGLIPKADWNNAECRIPRNIDKALEIFSETGVKATFFTLGWVADRHPAVVRKIADNGHEIASHGMEHVRVWAQDRAEFREDVTRSKRLLEDTCGKPVNGYRAASWSIDGRSPWAHEVLAEAGYQYSSSIYPVAHDHYGVPDAPTQPHKIDGILEVPASTIRAFGRNIPAGGGGFFRLYPLALSRRLIRQKSNSDGSPYVFYFHPWELDPQQPRVRGATFKARFRHYLNLEKFEYRLRRISEEFQWGRMQDIYLDGQST